MQEIIDYGGEWCSRGHAIQDMQRDGMSRHAIDWWLIGNDRHMANLRRTNPELFENLSV
jgi:hypothetical protein